MGMKLKCPLFIILLLVSAVLLNGCTEIAHEIIFTVYDHNMSNFDVAKISIERADINYYHAYFLSTDNVLYSLGACTSLNEYVCYIDKKQGIVAENVKDFGLNFRGGYYITNQNELYIWNAEKIPELGYSKNRSSQKILEGVVQADSGFDSVIYIDEGGRLCIIGTFNEIVYSPDDPYVMAEDAVRFDVVARGPFTIKGAYINMDGEIKFFGSNMEDYPYFSSIQNLSFENPESVEMFFWDTYCLILENGRLHFYGDYSIVDGNEEPNEVDDVILLDNVTCFSSSNKLTVAVDENGDGYVFGKCISNGLDNVEIPKREYYEKKKIISNVKNVCLSGEDICFVDKEGKTQFFGDNSGEISKGNSTDDKCVGINREPVTWE